MKIKADWNLTYRNGDYIKKWYLYINGKNVSNLIPETLICSNMNTYGTYQKKRNRRNRNILIYEDGLKCEDWIKFNEDWLNEITEDKEIQGQIYYEFQKHDFR